MYQLSNDFMGFPYIVFNLKLFIVIYSFLLLFC